MGLLKGIIGIFNTKILGESLIDDMKFSYLKHKKLFPGYDQHF